jgi:serine/threonine protein kinase
MIEIRILGKGAFGTVKLMEDAVTKERFAVKFFNEPGETNPDFGAKFMREVELMVSLQHPCILGIVGYSLPTPCLPAQIGTIFAVNGSLRSALDSQSLDDTGIVIVICGLVRGLQFLHSKNVMHRDLKPENILLDEHNWPQIGDFGSSRLVDLNLTQTREPGTPLYMAPELYDEIEYTTAVDIFSFGLILYELLVGRRVFPPTIAPFVLMKKVTSGDRPEIPGYVHATGKSVIHSCWDVKPELRPSIEQVLASFEAIEFRLTPAVDSRRVAAFTTAVSPK